MGLKEQVYKGFPNYDIENDPKRFIFKKETLDNGKEIEVMYRKGNPGFTKEEMEE